MTDDREISLINDRDLRCSGPTNILSFPGDRGERLGALMLSAVTMEREIVLYGQDPDVHAQRLLAHGMGHILGLDHGSVMESFCSCLEASVRESLDEA